MGGIGNYVIWEGRNQAYQVGRGNGWGRKESNCLETKGPGHNDRNTHGRERSSITMQAAVSSGEGHTWSVTWLFAPAAIGTVRAGKARMHFRSVRRSPGLQLGRYIQVACTSRAP